MTETVLGKMDLVKLYENQAFYTSEICGLLRDLPIRHVDDDIWIASNHELVLCDIEFTQAVGKELASRIKEYKPDCLFTAESKSLPIVYETAKNLDHKVIAVARKSSKAYMDSYIEEEVKSITTAHPQKLVIDKENIEKISKKRVCTIDDVVSTGGTMNALKNLVSKSKGEIVCEAAVWLEGPWYKGNLTYLSILPVFVSEKRYKAMTL